MPRQQLQQTLEQLHAQLAGAGPVDPEIRQLLETARHEIQAVLADDRPEPRPTLASRLREAAEHFEAEHPALTVTLGSLIDLLARMGI
jgi:hypothetical protein